MFKTRCFGGESTLDLCLASPEEILERQRPRHATGNRSNHHCGDDSILRTNVTRNSGSPCLGAMGASVWGVGLAGCRFLCAGKYIALLIEHEWAAVSTRHMRALSLLFMTWGHEWLSKRTNLSLKCFHCRVATPF